MLVLGGRTYQLCDGLSRRSFIKIGALGLAGLTLPALLRLQQAQAAPRRDTAVILYWMGGGPSHIDTYDMKPDAVAEVRGPFRPIPTRARGVHICELLPQQARVADKFALIRSLRHQHFEHNDAAHWVQTGYPEPGVINRGQIYPAQGAVVSHLRGPNVPGMPAYVSIPESYGTRRGFYQFASYLGPQHNPLAAGGDPPFLGRYRDPDFALPADLTLARLQDRRRLLSSIDGLARRVENNGALHSQDVSVQSAFELVTSPRVREAFELNREPARLREWYGTHAWGKAALLARRLVEAGVTFVTINHYEAEIDWWDDHYNIERNLRRRLPPFDQALARLIEDLHLRGLQERVLVIAMGEFGRGPRIDAQAGRGHWARAMSALVSGCGIRGGQIVGATTGDGGEPRERPLGPGDLLATVYHVLGIDPHRTLPDRQNRPMPLVPTGEVIRELF